MLPFLLIVTVAGTAEPQIVEPPPAAPLVSHSSYRSIGTLLVVLAVITIVGVLAGVFARACGGRHAAGGDHDVEGWVERKCRSCIDGGLPPPAPEQPKPAPEAASTKQ